MAIRIKLNKPDRIRFILLGFLFIILALPLVALQQSQQLTQDEFRQELRKAFLQKNNELAISLIRNHRLFAKPFVNDLIKESISKELKGKTTEYIDTQAIAEKTAGNFENIFGEKNLSIGVNYLTTWSIEQKEKKLIADSLYALGTKFRGSEPEKAVEIYQQAIELYKNIGDERGEAEILGGLGLI